MNALRFSSSARQLSAEPLRYVRQFELRWGGAECNFAIALARLGLTCGWLSRLGDDELGRLILQGARGEGVDVSRVKLIREHPTGLYLKQFVRGLTEVFYYRRGSAASFRSGASAIRSCSRTACSSACSSAMR